MTHNHVVITPVVINGIVVGHGIVGPSDEVDAITASQGGSAMSFIPTEQMPIGASAPTAMGMPHQGPSGHNAGAQYSPHKSDRAPHHRYLDPNNRAPKREPESREPTFAKAPTKTEEKIKIPHGDAAFGGPPKEKPGTEEAKSDRHLDPSKRKEEPAHREHFTIRDINEAVKGPTGGDINRSQFFSELYQKPWLVQKSAHMVFGEVGKNAPLNAQIVQLETVFNRSAYRGHSLEQGLLSVGEDPRRGYYAKDTYKGSAAPSAKELETFRRDVLGPVLRGSNLSEELATGTAKGKGPMTGNASDQPGNMVASHQFSRGTPGYKLPGGDTYFREGPFTHPLPRVSKESTFAPTDHNESTFAKTPYGRAEKQSRDFLNKISFADPNMKDQLLDPDTSPQDKALDELAQLHKKGVENRPQTHFREYGGGLHKIYQWPQQGDPSNKPGMINPDTKEFKPKDDVPPTYGGGKHRITNPPDYGPPPDED